MTSSLPALLSRLLAASLIAVSASALASTHSSWPSGLTVNGEPMPVEEVRETPLPGFFEVRLENGETFTAMRKASISWLATSTQKPTVDWVNITEQGRK